MTHHIRAIATKKPRILGLTLVAASLSFGLVPMSAEATASCTQGSTNTVSSGNVRTVTFSAGASVDGSCTWTVPNNVFIVDYLVVAGGGGGSSGGGGGGGVVTSLSNNANPLAVTPGASFSITVGRGGAGGAGGNPRYPAGQSGTQHQTQAQDGNNSSFGDIVANGGGAGGHASGLGRTGGSSGGNAYDNTTSTQVEPVATTIVGAASFGNSGGTSGQNSYSAGGGGGGAGSTGAQARTLPAGSGAETTNRRHGGGHGGSGQTFDISGSSVEYGCGGGGGVNSNTSVNITNGGGNAGCSNAGRGSAYALNNTTDTLAGNAIQATSGVDGTGGGGGGTDPEDTRGGRGGNGIVILRYTLVPSECPNSNSSTSTTPLACPTEVRITAGAAATTVSPIGGPISFSNNTATISVRSTPRANPTSGNLSATVINSNRELSISVPSGSSLIGGTYPVVFRITQGGSTSDSYILVSIDDPAQLSPYVVPFDPRANSTSLQAFEMGAIPNSESAMLCLDVDDQSPALTVNNPSGGLGSVTRENRANGVVAFLGTISNLESLAQNLTLTAANSEPITGTTARTVVSYVVRSANVGTTNCTAGTRREIQLRAVEASNSAVYAMVLD